MAEVKRDLFVLAGLILFAGVIFGLGIDWGLPSPARNAWLFPASVPGTSSHANRPSGAAIDHLAGEWPGSDRLPADMPQNPITDRSHPITLVENGLTAQQIASQGNTELSALQDALDKSRTAESSLADEAERNPRGLAAAQQKVSQNAIAVDQFVARFNREHIVDYEDGLARSATERARILRRFLLYSADPDEMLTLRALAQMNPDSGNFDPRLYEYGGLWLYPIAGILRVAWFFDLTPVVNDHAYFMDDSTAMGRYYMVIRAYAAAWGIVGMIGLFALMRRWTDGLLIPTLASLGFVLMPITIDLGHLGRPYLPAASLMILGLWAGTRYLESGSARWIIGVGLALGAAMSMAPWAITAFPLVLVFACLRCQKGGKGSRLWIKPAISGKIAAILVFLLTNPYLVLHAIHLHSDPILKANVAHLGSMYWVRFGFASIADGLRLIILGTSWPIAVAGLLGIVVLMTRKPEASIAPLEASLSDAASGSLEFHATESEDHAIEKPSVRQIGLILLGTGLIPAMGFIAIAAGQPGDVAGLAVFVDIALFLAAMTAIARVIPHPKPRLIAAFVLVLAAALHGQAYERAAIQDGWGNGSRDEAAKKLAEFATAWGPTRRPILGIPSDPAPFNLPPVDLFRWKIVLLPIGSFDRSRYNVIIKPMNPASVFDFNATPITGANWPFSIDGIQTKPN